MEFYKCKGKRCRSEAKSSLDKFRLRIENENRNEKKMKELAAGTLICAGRLSRLLRALTQVS